MIDIDKLLELSNPIPSPSDWTITLQGDYLKQICLELKAAREAISACQYFVDSLKPEIDDNGRSYSPIVHSYKKLGDIEESLKKYDEVVNAKAQAMDLRQFTSMGTHNDRFRRA